MTGIRIYPKTEIEIISQEEGIISCGDPLLASSFYFPEGAPGPILAEVIEAASARRNWFLLGERYWSSAMGPRPASPFPP